MPFSFIEIEERKKTVIFFLFLFMVLFYFFGAWCLTVTVRFAFLVKTTNSFRHLFFLPFQHLLTIFFIALIAGGLHWYFSVSTGVEMILRSLRARPPDKEDTYHQKLQHIVDEVGVATGGRRIECVVLPLFAMNAFSIADFKNRAVIGVTEGLIARLKRAQLEAVVAHEAAHIVSQDTLIKTITASLFGVYAVLLAQLKKSIEASFNGSYRSRGPHPAVILIFIVTAIIHGVGKVLSMFISRQCEYRADAVAVRLVRDPLSLAQSLYKISRNWRGGGFGAEQMESLFIVNPNFCTLDEEEGFFANLFSTHPPLSRRMRILLDMGHSDLTTLKEEAKDIKKVRRKEVHVTTMREPRWYVERGGLWEGPLLMRELVMLGGITHDCFVRREGSDKITFLYQDGELLRHFKAQGESGSTQGCPRCGSGVSKVLYEGVPVHQCTLCKGVLLEDEKIPRILVREDQGFSDEVIKQAQVVEETARTFSMNTIARMRHELICPQCGQVMMRNFYNYAYPIEVDRCYNCKLIWFDKDELEVLQYLVEKANSRG